MAGPDDDVDVEEIDASELESEESGVVPMPEAPAAPAKPLDGLRARLNLKPPAPSAAPKDLFSEASAASRPVSMEGGLFGLPTATPTTPTPAPAKSPSSTMALADEDAWFEDGDAPPKPSPRNDSTSPGIIPVARAPSMTNLPALSATPAIAVPRTLTPPKSGTAPAGATALRPPAPPSKTPVTSPTSVAADAASHDASSNARPARAASAAGLDELIADLDVAAPYAKPRPTTVPPATSPATATGYASVDSRSKAKPNHDATTALEDDDVAIVVSAPAIPRTLTPHKKPPAPVEMLTSDERLVREAAALSTEFPMRAALLHAVRAFTSADDAPYKLAAKLAPDARFVAFTRRWLAAGKTDNLKEIDAAVRAELPLAGDANERAALLWQVAANPDAAAAEKTLRQIVELDAQDIGAWLGLAVLAMRRKQWAAAAEAFEYAGGKTDDAMARAAFFSSAGGLREARCSDDAGARLDFDRAFESDPESAATVSGLEMLALRTNAKSDHVRMVALEARRIGDLDPALGFHERAGDLYWEAMRDAVNAAQCYEHAAKLAPTDVVALGKLASLYEQEGRHVALAAVYESLLDRIAEPVRRGAVLLRLGGLYESRLDRAMDALRCYQAALAAVPTLAPAAQALARLHQTRQRWGEAAMVLMVEVDRLENPHARAARYLAIAEMLEANLGTIPQVVKLYERALQLDAGQTAALDALDRFYRSNGRWNDLIALYETQLQHSSHPMRVRADRIALAALYHDRAAAPDKAAKMLEQAMSGAPDHLFTQIALARALADAGKWAEHVAVLEQQAKLVADGPELVATLYRIASVVEVRLGDPVRALDAYKRVLAKAPRHELAAQAQLRLHSSQARWEDAIASERKLLELVERPEEAAVILHRIAHVAEEHLARPDDAIAAYEKALEKMPSYRPARVSLERLLRAANKFEQLAKLLEEQASGATGIDRARLLCGAALVREMHVPGPAAAKLYAEALVAEATMPAALWGQLRMQLHASEWKPASETLARICAQAKPGKPRARLMVQLVRVLELRLNDADRAAVLAEQAFGSDADPAIILERLRLAMVRGEPDTLQWLEESARVTTDPKLASAFLRVRASVIEVAGDRETAAEAYAIAMQHGSVPAVVEGLARNRTGPALGEALAIRAAQMKDAPTKALLYTIAGKLLEQPDASANAYSAALAAQPGLYPALEGLLRLSVRTRDFRGAATICAEMAAVAADKRNRVELFEEAAGICSDRLNDDVQAIGHYREVLADDPGRVVALDRVLELFERQGDWSTAAQLIGEQIQAVSDEKRADLLAQRARIYAERLGDGPAAIADLERALALLPDSPELLSLIASLHESLQQWADAARSYELLSKVTTGEQRGRALVAQARIWTAEVPDYARAQRILEEAAKLDPDDRGITARLAEVTSLAGDTKRAMELYQELATHGLPVDRIHALLAYCDLRKRNGEANSIDALAPAFGLAFDDFEVVRLLEGYYRLNDKLDRYLVHAEAAVMKARPTGRWNDTGPLRVSVGKIYAQQGTSAPPNASPFLEAAVEDAPDDVKLRITLASSYARVNDASAIRELRLALEREPTNTLAYQRLVEACARTGRELASALLATAAALLEGEDRAAIVIPHPVSGSLGPDEALAMFAGATRAPDVRRLAAHLSPYLGQIFGEKAKLEDAVPLPETYPVAGVIRSIASALGVGDLAMYWRDRADVTLVAVDPPALLIGARAVKDDPAKIRFDVGYALARLAGGSAMCQIARLDEVTQLLLAVMDTDGDEDWRKRVSSALPRRARKELEKLVPELGVVDAKRIALWDAEERRRALACGVIASCDMRTVAASLCPEAGSGDRRVKLRANPMMAEALRLATSDECWGAIQRFYGRP